MSDLKEQLLPCAHCGAVGKIKRGKTVMVSCTECSASTFQVLADTSGAIAAWNHRAPAAAPAPVAAITDAQIETLAARFGIGPAGGKMFGRALLNLAAAPPAPAAAPIVQPVADEWTPLDYRAQGREEALAALLAVEPESGINDYMDSGPCPATGEYGTTWNELKLRDLFAIGDCKHDAYERAEAAYWQAQGEKDEAERAKNFAANMHSSGKVRDVLEAAGEYDLIATLCATPASSTADAKDAAPAIIGYITTGDVEYGPEGAEVGGWDIDWQHKIIDAMDEFAVPETTYGVCLVKLDEARAAITSSAGEVKP